MGAPFPFLKSAQFVVLCAILSVVGALQAETTNDSPVNIDATLAPIIARAEIPGMAAVVLRGDKVVALGVAGVRKRGAPELISPNDQFQICSCTKAMTATVAAILIEEGKLGWDTTIAEIFGDTINNVNPAWRTVTLRQILAHRAGLNDHMMSYLPELLSGKKSDLPKERRKYVARVLARAPDSPPGTKFVYSNTDYILVGAALEKITGRSWEDLLQERLFRPLGITSGGFGPPGASGQIDQPWGHGRHCLFHVPLFGHGNTPFDPDSTGADYPSMYGPAGTVHLSIGDWAKFAALHLRGDPANPNCQASVLRPDTFRRLHEAAPGEDYFGGWVLTTKAWAKGGRPGDIGRVFFHVGDNGRWNSVVWIAPEIDFAVLVVCNRGSMWGPCDQVAAALLGTFAAKPLPSRANLPAP